MVASAISAAAVLKRGAVDRGERAVVAPLEHRTLASTRNGHRATSGSRRGQWAVLTVTGDAEVRLGPKQLLERPATIVQLRSQHRADEPYMPWLRAISGDPLLAVRIAERESMLVGVLGQPRHRSLRWHSKIDGGAELVLAVARPRRTPDLLRTTEQQRLLVVRAKRRFDPDVVPRGVCSGHQPRDLALDRCGDAMPTNWIRSTMIVDLHQAWFRSIRARPQAARRVHPRQRLHRLRRRLGPLNRRGVDTVR